MDSDSGDDNPMNNKPLVDKSKEIKGKKKNFGGKGGNQKEFIPSEGLTPEMKANGFIVDKSLHKLAKMLTDNGVDCKVLPGVSDSE